MTNIIRRLTMNVLPLCGMTVACLLTAACEKVVFDDDGQQPASTGRGNVVLTVADFEPMKGGMRSSVSLTEVCSRLHFVVYSNGDRLKSVHQKKGDTVFGTVELSLEAGDYEVLIVGHSGTGTANPTMTHPEKVQFSNITTSGGGTGYSDTFYYFDNLTVGDRTESRSYTLRRATAMVRFVTTDAKPDKVRRLWFQIKGGSGAFDAYTGLGCVNSTQVMVFDLSAEDDGRPLQLDLFTFPRETTGLLEMQVRALDANENIVYERAFKGIPVERNVISQLAGTFFIADAPEDPTVPGTPDDPETPGTPDDPETPDTPEVPDTPDNPGTPDTPSTPDSPSPTFVVDTDWTATRYYTF